MVIAGIPTERPRSSRFSDGMVAGSGWASAVPDQASSTIAISNAPKTLAFLTAVHLAKETLQLTGKFCLRSGIRAVLHWRIDYRLLEYVQGIDASRGNAYQNLFVPSLDQGNAVATAERDSSE